MLLPVRPSFQQVRGPSLDVPIIDTTRPPQSSKYVSFEDEEEQNQYDPNDDVKEYRLAQSSSTTLSTRYLSSNDRMRGSQIITNIGSRIKSLFNKGHNKYKDWVKVFLTSDRLQATVSSFVDKAFSNLEQGIAFMLQDPLMPLSVKEAFQEMFEYYWGGLKDMMKQDARSMFMQEQFIIYKQQPITKWYLKPVHRLRSILLYCYQPFDASIWQQLRDPYWWFLNMFQYTPQYGMQTITYLLIFLAIDKRETFQLVNFILGYKSAQFMANGIFNPMQGYFSYFYCGEMARVLHDPQAQPRDYCAYDNPGNIVTLFLDAGFYVPLNFGAFVMQIVLLWSAYISLHFSQPLEKQPNLVIQHIAYKSQTQDQIDRRRSRLTYMMRLDLLMFFISLGVFSVLVMMQIQIQKIRYYLNMTDFQISKLNGLVFLLQCVYGILSMPFATAQLLAIIFTEARPNAYDRNANLMFLPGSAGTQLVYTDDAQIPTSQGQVTVSDIQL